jgi:nucleoid DNA-binding protein
MSANKLTKKDIVRRLSAEMAGEVSQRQTASMVQGVLDTIVMALRDGKNVELRNFGVFEIQVRRARIGRNPNRPEIPITIPQQRVVKFKSGKELRQSINR